MEPRRRHRNRQSPVRRRSRGSRGSWVGVAAGLGVVVVGVLVWIGVDVARSGSRVPHTGGAPHAASSSVSGTAGSASQSSTSQSSISGTATLTVQWHSLPAGTNGITSAASGPNGSVWALSAGTSGGALWQFTGTAQDGQWPLPAGQDVPLQTVGPAHVWLGTVASELSFSRKTHTFAKYGGAGTVATATVGGYSVALDVPGTANGQPNGVPYVMVAPIGGSAHPVQLPGAVVPAHPLGAVLAGPSGEALVASDGQVWALPVAGGAATAWATLTTSALPAPLAWGGGRLWYIVGPTSAPTGIGHLAPGQTTAALAQATAHPPAAGTGLAYADGDLWWAGNTHLFGYDPSTGAVTEATLPASATSPVLMADAGGLWVARGTEYAQVKHGIYG